MKSLNLPKLSQRGQIPKLIVLCFLLLMIVLGAIPSYLTGKWQWTHPPKVTNLKQLRNLREKGLTIPGWQTVKQQVGQIGGHKWSVQQLQGNSEKLVTLLLFPQNGDKDQPEIEWVDIDGAMGWQTDSYQSLNFQVQPLVPGTSKLEIPQIARIEARFFRAWQQLPKAQTFAVVQWYAWSGTGHPTPSQWFWADQAAQWQRRRLPWVAVCLQIPIEPLGDIEKYRLIVESLAQKVQGALMADVF